MFTFTDPRLIRFGQFIFPLRGHVGIPFLLLALCLCKPNDLAVWPGWALLVCGLGLRLWGVAGWVPTRRAGDRSDHLITIDGPYVYTRNPRYLGNLLMGLGGCGIAGLTSCWGPYLLFWAALHFPIIAFEEHGLAAHYGREYLDYCQSVPRFWGWTGKPLAPQILPLDWKLAFSLEMTTEAGWLTLGLFFQAWRRVAQGGARTEYALALAGGVLVWLLLLKLRAHFHRTRVPRER